MSRFSLIGTITSDHITYDSGSVLHGLGGILYQASVLCGLGEDVNLISNCGLELEPVLERLIAPWATLRREGLRYVDGPGNQVHLRYSDRLKEREEVLQSAVPPLDPAEVLAWSAGADMVVMVFNSGFEFSPAAWRRFVDQTPCPIWLDTHSLVLAKRIGSHRDYVAIPDWREWVAGVAYLQANRQEMASLLGHPDHWPEPGEVAAWTEQAFRLGVRGIFVTQGKDGVAAFTPRDSRVVSAPAAERIVDTTGCGDVFCAKTAQLLAGGIPVMAAVSEGVRLASRAVGLAGIAETYALARAATT